MGRISSYFHFLRNVKKTTGTRGVLYALDDRFLHIRKEQPEKENETGWTIYDILFVNGCPPETIPHPYRYRVLHQMEQLRAAGYTVNEVVYTKLQDMHVLNANTLVFYRCPYTEVIGSAIRLAKSMNKKVLFDVDDLIIDTKYTDQVPSIQKLNRKERALYDEGVTRYGTTMRMCDAGTTSTNRILIEMKKVLPEVYLNRNCASERMVELSEQAWKKRLSEKKEEPQNVIIGYFSGTITHNADFEMIRPALIRVLDENPNVRLMLVGLLDLPEVLKDHKDKIIQKPLVKWEKLPELISEATINLAPVEDTIFNEAKSENKWVEAAMVHVPTVASRVGPFKELIQDGITGYLANADEWYEVLTRAVRNPEERTKIAEQAYQYCRKHCVTTENTAHVRKIYEKVRSPHVAFVLPSTEISGGIMVALRHACFLQDAGWNVDIIAHNAKKGPIWEEFGHTFACIPYGSETCNNLAAYDMMIGTMWLTLDYIDRYRRPGKKVYLVQGYEKEFYPYNYPDRLDCEATYFLPKDWSYVTISEWCKGWLKEKYEKDCVLLKDGMETEKFHVKERDWSQRRIRILIEGDCAVDYKNVDESFRIADRLDREKYEIWYMSYNAKPKDCYHYDKFLHAVPYDKVSSVYEECDILLKSSWLEGFSYPPLEMMATGGWCVAVQNEGNSEYLRHEENALVYHLGDEDDAVKQIERLVTDAELRRKLRMNGIETAKSRDWKLLAPKIVEEYQKLLNESK